MKMTSTIQKALLRYICCEKIAVAQKPFPPKTILLTLFNTLVSFEIIPEYQTEKQANKFYLILTLMP